MIKGRGNDRMKEKKRKKKRVIPGFGLSFGITIAMLGFIVVIPLCTLVIFSAKLSFTEFITTVTRPRVLSSYRVSLQTALIAALIDAVMQEGLKKKRTNWHTRCFPVLKQDSAVVYIKKEKSQDSESALQKANVQQKVTIRVPIT